MFAVTLSEEPKGGCEVLPSAGRPKTCRPTSRDKRPLFTPFFIFSERLFLSRHTDPVDAFRSPIRLHVVSVLHRTSHPSGSRHRDLLYKEKAIPAPGSPSPSKSSVPYRVHVAKRLRRRTC